jgi:hypothetical protein
MGTSSGFCGFWRADIGIHRRERRGRGGISDFRLRIADLGYGGEGAWGLLVLCTLLVVFGCCWAEGYRRVAPTQAWWGWLRDGVPTRNWSVYRCAVPAVFLERGVTRAHRAILLRAYPVVRHRSAVTIAATFAIRTIGTPASPHVPPCASKEGESSFSWIIAHLC